MQINARVVHFCLVAYSGLKIVIGNAKYRWRAVTNPKWQQGRSADGVYTNQRSQRKDPLSRPYYSVTAHFSCSLTAVTYRNAAFSRAMNQAVSTLEASLALLTRTAGTLSFRTVSVLSGGPLNQSLNNREMFEY
jgi:hypothetical protein